MNLNFTIKNLEPGQLDNIKFKCSGCNYWCTGRMTAIIDDLSLNYSFWQMVKSKFFELKNLISRKNFIYSLISSGGIAKAAFRGKKCTGILMAGKYYLFPRLKYFNVFPPDSESIFLGCLFVDPDYRNLGIGKKLIISLEKDLINNKVKSIEAIAKRVNDDMELEEYINSPLIPVKYLVKQGFYIKKNDVQYPLLRLDLSALSIAKEFLKGKLTLRNLVLERAVKSPVTMGEEEQ
jgi:ribosomal protein S18 acetylase RimI-like enzyme